MDYIANSKNRKFKKQILVFLDRINFGALKLPISGRLILLLVGLLLLSLFFPWLHFEYSSGDSESYSAFSGYTGYIGYGIIVSLLIIPFFLLSHTKKEKIRAYMPFRLSDTQVVVFVTSIIITSLCHLLLLSPIFGQFAINTEIGAGFLIAISSSICIVVAAFFLSKRSKEESVDLRHIDHREASIPDEYATIL
jgi:hypothetical protein